MVGFGTADGSRAKYYRICGHLTPEQQCRAVGHYMVLELIFFSADGTFALWI